VVKLPDEGLLSSCIGAQSVPVINEVSLKSRNELSAKKRDLTATLRHKSTC